MTLNNLGNVQINMNRFEAAVASYPRKHVSCMFKRLESMFGSAQLMERIRLHKNYANLVQKDLPKLNLPDHGLARELLRVASQFAEKFRGMFANPRERLRVQQQQRSLFANRVAVCLTCGDLFNDQSAYEEALEAAEASRSRSLLDALAQQITPENAPFDLIDKFQTLQGELRRAQRRLHQETQVAAKLAEGVESDQPTAMDDDEDDKSSKHQELTLAQPRFERSSAALTQRLAAQQDQAQRIAEVEHYITQRQRPCAELGEKLRKCDATFNPDAVVESFRLSDLERLLPADKRTAFVHLQLDGERAIAMVLSQSGLKVIPLPELDAKQAKDLAMKRWRRHSWLVASRLSR